MDHLLELICFAVASAGCRVRLSTAAAAGLGFTFFWIVCHVSLPWICFITSIASWVALPVMLTQWQATRIPILCNQIFLYRVQRKLFGTGVQGTGPIAAFVITVAFFGVGVDLGNPAFTALVIETTVLHHPAAQCDSCIRQQQHGKAQKRHGFVGYLGGLRVSGRRLRRLSTALPLRCLIQNGYGCKQITKKTIIILTISICPGAVGKFFEAFCLKHISYHFPKI